LPIRQRVLRGEGQVGETAVCERPDHLVPPALSAQLRHGLCRASITLAHMGVAVS
jgi:hypothetical protein